MVGLSRYFAFYNSERPHQSLDNKAPDVVYRTGMGGGAMIVDKFGGAGEEPVFRYAPQAVPPPQQQDQKQEQLQKQRQQPKQRQNRGSAIQLHVKLNAQLKPGRILS